MPNRVWNKEEEFLIKKTFQSKPQSTQLNKTSKLAEYIRNRAGPQFERGRVLVHTVLSPAAVRWPTDMSAAAPSAAEAPAFGGGWPHLCC